MNEKANKNPGKKKGAPASGMNNRSTSEDINNLKRPHPDADSAVPVDKQLNGIVDLGNGVMMSPSEILDFAEGTDNCVPDKEEAE